MLKSTETWTGWIDIKWVYFDHRVCDWIISASRNDARLSMYFAQIWEFIWYHPSPHGWGDGYSTSQNLRSSSIDTKICRVLILTHVSQNFIVLYLVFFWLYVSYLLLQHSGCEPEPRAEQLLAQQNACFRAQGLDPLHNCNMTMCYYHRASDSHYVTTVFFSSVLDALKHNIKTQEHIIQVQNRRG